MKFLIAMITSLIIFSNTTHAFDQWCPQAPEVNYRATLAVDNIDYLEDEVRFYYSNRTRGAIGYIQGLRGVLNNLIRITDFDQSNCYSIQASFYTADWQLRSLSRIINRLLARRPQAPVKSTWETFVRSFIKLESVIIELGGGYNFPRGPFYRRYFPGFRRFFPAVRPGRRERRLDRRERRLERRGRRLDGRTGRRNINRNPNRNPNRNMNRNPNRNPNRNMNRNPNRNPNRNMNRNPNRNPNRNMNGNPNRNPNRNPGSRRNNSRRDRRPRR